jgi:hypothetical protein
MTSIVRGTGVLACAIALVALTSGVANAAEPKVASAATPSLANNQFVIKATPATTNSVHVELKLPAAYRLTQAGPAISLTNNAAPAGVLAGPAGTQYSNLTSVVDSRAGFTDWGFSYNRSAPLPQNYWDDCSKKVARGFAGGAVVGCVATLEAACVGGPIGGVTGAVAGLGACGS